MLPEPKRSYFGSVRQEIPEEIRIVQKKDGWCGPAVLSYALAEQGMIVHQDDLAESMHVTMAHGVDPKELEKEAEKRGMSVDMIEDKDSQKTLDILDEAIDNGKSVIVDFLDGDSKEDGHYVLYQGRSEGNIHSIDPQTAKMRDIPEAYFIRHWKDTTISGKIFKRWAMIMER